MFSIWIIKLFVALFELQAYNTLKPSCVIINTQTRSWSFLLRHTGPSLKMQKCRENITQRKKKKKIVLLSQFAVLSCSLTISVALYLAASQIHFRTAVKCVRKLCCSNLYLGQHRRKKVWVVFAVYFIIVSFLFFLLLLLSFSHSLIQVQSGTANTMDY